MTETITHIAAKKVGVEVFTTLPNVTVSVNENQCLGNCSKEHKRRKKLSLMIL